MDIVKLKDDPKIASELLRIRWHDAFRTGDARALSATFAQDGIYLPWSGPFPIEGRGAIRDAFEGYFLTFPVRRIVIRDESIHIYGNTSIYNCNWTLSYGDGKGPIKTVYGRTSAADTLIESQKDIDIESEKLFVLMAMSLLPTGGP